MKIAPLQSFGIGDVIFCQTLANDWISQGHEVIWGVEPYFVEGLNRAYPNVKFVDKNTLPIDYNRRDEHDANGYRVVPLRWSVEIAGLPYKDCMKTKYSIFNMDWQRWREGATWQRDYVRETSLFNLLNPTNEPYNLIHCNFGSDVKFRREITVDNGLKNIYVEVIPGMSLFDYALVYQNAKNIHAVASSNVYIMEMLPLQADEIHIYKRDRMVNGKFATEPHSHYDYIMTTHEYRFHE